jgi:hypothetical protein
VTGVRESGAGPRRGGLGSADDQSAGGSRRAWVEGGNIRTVPIMTTEDTPMTPAAPVIDERQKALDKYKDRLLKHRCVRRRRGAAPTCLALHAPVPGGASCATVWRRGALHPHDPRSCSPVRFRGLAAPAPTDAADLPVLGYRMPASYVSYTRAPDCRQTRGSPAVRSGQTQF